MKTPRNAEVTDRSEDRRVCPKTGRVIPPGTQSRWRTWLLPGAGLASLLWFLIRVLPKPSRAAYPCQRVAFPIASGFVVWVTALLGSAFAWRRARAPRVALWRACLWLMLAGTASAVVVVLTPSQQAAADQAPAHVPLGVAKGIFPGRVVWVHAPEATDWAGYSSAEHWYQANHTDLAVVEEMLSKALRSLAGQNSIAAAWDTIFKHFNETHGHGQRGYQAGEKIAIKINLTTCNARSGTDTVDIDGTYEKRNSYSGGHWLNTIDNSPQMTLTLLRQLVYQVGVAPSDIAIGDPTGLFPKYMYDQLHPEFPDVIYFDNYGRAGSGRTRTEFSTTRFDWSTTDAAGKIQDYVPAQFAEAMYLINFPVLKGHSCGVTVCAKNHYGSLLRCPDGYLREAGNLDYYSMHDTLADMGNLPNLGHYRALVDLMGHPELGGKTLLYLVDALYCGYYWDSHPYKWKMPPFGDGVNGDWPSSVFASLDPVAIDSVGYDFLRNEWPQVVTGSSGQLGEGPQDYLHEAAQATNPPSGTYYDPGKTGSRLLSLGVHEHWNNPTDKQYSRNLGTGTGIELLALTAGRPTPQLAIRRDGNQTIVSWQASLTNCQLQSAAQLGPTTTWSNVNTTPVRVQDRSTVTNPITEASHFYRVVR
jgi:ketosteroid isomerase-like protein